jgi:hypothetical protein
MSYAINNISLSSYYGRETLNEEFKEYCLKSLNLFFSHSDIKKVYEDPLFRIDTNIFNKMVRYDMTNYIVLYLSKYIGNFSASNISGNLHFGISDFGIIEGIPYFGSKIPRTFINKAISTCIKDYIRVKNSDDGSVLKWFKHNIKTVITKLKVNPLLLDDDVNDRLEKIKLNNLLVKKEWDNYQIEYSKWYSELLKYSIKLKTLINDSDIRKEIVSFIRKYIEENCITDTDYLLAIQFYESDIVIDHEINKDMLYSFSNSDPFRWLILFKDYILNEIKMRKPKVPLSRSFDINYFDFAKHMYNCRNYLVDNKCNFFKITFIIPRYPDNCILEYKDKHGNWNCKMRSIDTQGPCSKLCHD